MTNIIKPHAGPQTFALRQPTEVKEILYGGMRGGGKTLAGLVWIGNRLYKDENNEWQPVRNHRLYRALVIRRNADDLSDWVERLKQIYPEANVAYRPYEIRFPSGALIRTGHLKDEQAYGKYQGAEFQSVLVEELTQIPLEKRYVQLISSCRSTILELRPQIFLTTNPGGLGHGWVKKRFIDVAKPNEVYTDPRGNRRIFIPSSIEDNPTLIKNDPDYVKMLDSLKDTDEELWKAWRLGDWNVFAGQAFREWRVSKHVVNQFDYPLELCQRIISFDWGYRDKGVASWLAFTPENKWGVRRCYLYRQLVQTETDPEKWAEQISTYCSIDKVKYMVMPPDTFAHKESKVTIASTFQKALTPHNIPIIKADASPGSRLNRKAITHQFLADAPDGKPYLQVHESCTDFIESIPTLVYDERNVEDVAEGDDHCLRGDTQVLTTKGYRSIKSLIGTTGQLVSNGSVEKYHSVRKTGSATIYQLEFNDGTIVHASSEHPFLTDRGWVSTIDIRPLDRIQCIHESKSNIRHKTNIQWRKLLQNVKLLPSHKQEIQRLKDIAPHSLGTSQWTDRKRLADTPQRRKSLKQSGRKSRITRAWDSFKTALRVEQKQPRMVRSETQTHKRSNVTKSLKMAQFNGREGMAQKTLPRNERKTTLSTETHKKIPQRMWNVWFSFHRKLIKSKMVQYSMSEKTSRQPAKTLIKRSKLGREDVYNMEVDNTHCFAIQGGIIVHNSYDSATYGIVAFVKSNPGLIIKQNYGKSKYPTAPTVVNGMVKPTEDIMDIIKRDMDKKNRSWQT